jgi:hypothetical protein
MKPPVVGEVDDGNRRGGHSDYLRRMPSGVRYRKGCPAPRREHG